MKADAALERLRELAREAAGNSHEHSVHPYASNACEGHFSPFETCPHPDCVLVRAVPQAPEAFDEPEPDWFPNEGDRQWWREKHALSPAPSGEPVDLDLEPIKAYLNRWDPHLRRVMPLLAWLGQAVAEIERLRGAVVPVERPEKEIHTCPICGPECSC